MPAQRLSTLKVGMTEPAKVIRKRCFKNFNSELFLSDLSAIDWYPVYASVETFSDLFLTALDKHAPWSQFQQRKRLVP